jgi:hypothetical protein
MHPGMPPGRNHFRRSRDAPKDAPGVSGTATAEQQPMSKNYRYPTALDGIERQGDSRPLLLKSATSGDVCLL